MNLNRGHGTSFGVIPGFLFFFLFFIFFFVSSCPLSLFLDFLIHGVNILYIFFLYSHYLLYHPYIPGVIWPGPRGQSISTDSSIRVAHRRDGELSGPVFEIRERGDGGNGNG